MARVTVCHGYVGKSAYMPPRRPRFETRFCHISTKALLFIFKAQIVIHFMSIASYGKCKLEK